MEEEKVVELKRPLQWGKMRTEGVNDWRRKQEKRMFRHSRFVVMMKVLLPSLAALLIGLIILWPQLNAGEEGFSLAAADAERIGLPEEQAMVNPRFFSVDQSGQPFNMTAEEAFEMEGETRRVRLNGVRADVSAKNGRWYALDAETALYTQATDMLDLSGQVNVYTDEGYELETTQASVSILTHDISGNEKTLVRGADGYAVSDGFSVTDEGKVVRLSGKTRLIFYPPKED